MWGHGKKTAACEPGSRQALPDTESADALILDFPTFKTTGNKLLFEPLSLLFFYSSLNKDSRPGDIEETGLECGE